MPKSTQKSRFFFETWLTVTVTDSIGVATSLLCVGALALLLCWRWWRRPRFAQPRTQF